MNITPNMPKLYVDPEIHKAIKNESKEKGMTLNGLGNRIVALGWQAYLEQCTKTHV